MSLFQKRRFLPYFLTQFLGAFNDNVFKNALVIVFTYHLAANSNNSDVLVNLAAIIFILPFFLFSPFAGQLADKYEKSRLIRRIKTAEICIMVLGAIGLYWQSVPWMLFVLFLMGTQSTFFGPIKYSILPQSLAKEELLHGNAMVEAGTFIAILLGTILGTVLAGGANFALPVTIAILFFAVLGRWVSRSIPIAEAANPQLVIDKNLIRSGKDIFKNLHQNPHLFLTAVAISWFWFFGALFLTQLPNFAKNTLGSSPYVATILMSMFSIGIGLGSFLCSKMSGKKVEIGIVPIGAIGMTLAGLYIGCVDIQSVEASSHLKTLLEGNAWQIFQGVIQEVFQRVDTLQVMLGLLILAISGGLFVVPLYAYLQAHSSPENISRNFAALNMLNALFMVVAGIFAIVVFALGNSIQSLFIITALMNAAVALYVFVRVPDFIVRFGAWLMVHSLYRIGKHDLHHIPLKGPAVLAANHVSFVDPIIVAAVSERPVRFVMYYKIYQLPIIHFLFKTMGAIPIASAKENSALLDKAYEDIAEALQNDELVCIFPEGGLTPDGEIQMFKRGIEKILQRTPVPVVPMALQGLWGTWFSREGGRAMKGFPRNWMKKIDVITGTVLEANDADLSTIETCVRTLRQDRR